MLQFVTGNEGKVREARSYLDREVEQTAYDYVEIQADDPEPVAVAGAKDAFATIDGDVLVDDSGLFIEGLDGFPGPYSAYVENTLGIERVYQIADRADAKQAAFRSVVAYATNEPVPVPDRGIVHGPNTDGTVVVTFEGRVPGRIVAPRGEGGFGYDPIFEHDGRTLAERSTEEKNAISHRGRALAKLADWLE